MAQLRERVPYICVPLVSSTIGVSAKVKRAKLFLQLVDRANLQGARYLHFTSDAESKRLATSISLLPTMCCL